MLVYRMTLVSFRLIRKNLGILREFFGQMVYRPPWSFAVSSLLKLLFLT